MSNRDTDTDPVLQVPSIRQARHASGRRPRRGEGCAHTAEAEGRQVRRAPNQRQCIQRVCDEC